MAMPSWCQKNIELSHSSVTVSYLLMRNHYHEEHVQQELADRKIAHPMDAFAGYNAPKEG